MFSFVVVFALFFLLLLLLLLFSFNDKIARLKYNFALGFIKFSNNLFSLGQAEIILTCFEYLLACV